MAFHEIDLHSLNKNVFKMIEDEWFLITAGNKEKLNTMTANWGGFGFLWHKNICFIFVRPTRYTYEFIEKNESFTLSFFNENYRKALDFCGSKSGRDFDKVKECGFTPVEFSKGTVSFEEANLVLTCRKIYHQDLNPDNFIDKAVEKNYPKKDYHRMYIGEILKVFSK